MTLRSIHLLKFPTTVKTFKTQDLPENLKQIAWDLLNLSTDDKGGAEFQVLTGPDPELGNTHIPLAQWLVKNGAKKGETVYIENIRN